MKVTVCQWNPHPDELSKNLSELAKHIQSHGTDFVLLPEMSFSPWLASSPEPDRMAWGRAVFDHKTQIAQLDQLKAKAIMGTRPILTPCGSRRNQAYVWTEGRPEASPLHEKYYLPDEPGYWEATWYERGEKQFDVARALGARIGVQICTEMWFFEWARHYAKSRVDMLCIPRATPNGSTEKWLAGGQTAAVCSGAYCLSSNLWAPQVPGSEVDLGGLGWVIDPDGNVLATTSEAQPYVTVEIDLDVSKKAKGTYPRYVAE